MILFYSTQNISFSITPKCITSSTIVSLNACPADIKVCGSLKSINMIKLPNRVQLYQHHSATSKLTHSIHNIIT